MVADMQTMAEYRQSVRDFAYFGERQDWLIAYTIHRDSDVLDLANFEALADLAGDAAEVETFSHWLVGHGSWLLIDPADTEAVALVQAALDKLEDYPLVDEELYSEMEHAEACDTASSALYELGIPSEIRADVAGYVVSWGCDNGGKDDYAYAGVRDYWPSKQAQFWGYVRYRRSLRATA